MARIDFYVVAGSGEPARQSFACRLAEKAYRQRNTVHIEVVDAAAAQVMDELLWTFRDGSFVPHEITGFGNHNGSAPVTVGSYAPARQQPDLVINLTNNIPKSCGSFTRIAEIVTSDEESKTRSRQHFATYRKDGHALESHNI